MFNINTLIRKNIKELEPYSSARDEFQGRASVFLDANENPFPNGINRYPDPLQQELKNKISPVKSINPGQIFLGNGSDEAIDLLIRAFCEPGLDNIVSIKPTYGMYKVCANINNIEYREVLLTKDFLLDAGTLLKKTDSHTKIIFLCSPNNPTGNSLSAESIERTITGFNGIVVLDEAYIDFSQQQSFIEKLATFPNLVVLQTFSKAWGMAGIRLGMAFSSEEIIETLNKIKYPYNINILTQEKALEQLNLSPEKIKSNVSQIIQERKWLYDNLLQLDIVEHLYHSDANFILTKVADARKTYNYLCENKIIVRDRSNVALCGGCLRITVGTTDENKTLVRALQQFKITD
jgi:histidinol-phosphate aminotransferase